MTRDELSYDSVYEVDGEKYVIKCFQITVPYGSVFIELYSMRGDLKLVGGGELLAKMNRVEQTS